MTAAADRGPVERGAVWVLLALGLVLPTIIGLVTPYVVVAIGLVLWLALLVTGRLPGAYAPLSARLLLAAFAVLGLLFVLTMRAPGDALLTFNFTMLLLHGPLLWLFARAADERLFGRVVGLAALGVALTLVMVLFLLVTRGGRPGGFNLGPIELSNAALALAVVASAGAMVQRSRVSLLLPLSLAAALITTILTQSRGPLIAMGPMLLLTGIFLWRVRLRNWLFVAASGLGVAALGMLGVLLSGGRLAQLPQLVLGLASGQGTGDFTTDVRLSLYNAGWKAFLESPWIGHGWARLMSAALPYVEPQYLEEAQRLPQLHNDVVNFAVSGGVVGIAVYLLIIATPVVAAFASGHDGYRPARLYAASGLAIVYAGGGLTDLMFGHEFHTALYVLLVAIVFGTFREPPEAARPA
jgi:O-antigen ligase